MMGPPPAQAQGGGTSKIVPVVVSAGLAVGVFAGLLFGLGTGEPAYAARKIIAGKATPGVAAFDVSTEEFDETSVVPAGSAAGSNAGSGSGSDAGSAAPVPVPVVKMARLTFVVKPDGAPAKITIDGATVEGPAFEIDVTSGAKEVELVVKAPGFRDFKKKISVDDDEAIDVELIKRATGGGGGGGGGPTRRPGPRPDKIDI